MKKLFNILVLGVVVGLLFLSCKREKPNYIGPELGIASSDFKFKTSFKAQYTAINFVGSDNWFNASFNEKVSWKIDLWSINSKAFKTIKGYSNYLDNSNSVWNGGNSGAYFFQAGDVVVARLEVFGLKDYQYDTITVTAERVNYGSNTIVWWDMNSNGVAKNGTVYWYDFYDADSNPAVIGVGERMEDFLNNPHTNNDPIQGMYRSMEGTDGIGASNYFIGGVGHTYMSSATGFTATLDDVYLNFYVRRRTSTSAMGVSLTSLGPLVGDTSVLSYEVGKLDFIGWKLISIKLSQMKKDTVYNKPFNPAHIVKFAMNLQIHTNVGKDDTGFDMDMITFTKGAPFNPDK